MGYCEKFTGALLSILLIIGSGCGNETQLKSSSQTEQSSVVTDSSTDQSVEERILNSKQEIQSESGMDEQDINYEEIVKSLNSLLCDEWETTESLNSTDIVMWYAELQDQNSEDLFKYRMDGKEGLYFPQEVIEQAAGLYFDIKPEQIRKDENIYLKDRQVYKTPRPTGPLSHKLIKITKIDKGELITAIHFNIIFNHKTAESKNKVLTIKYGNPVKYLSYVIEDIK